MQFILLIILIRQACGMTEQGTGKKKNSLQGKAAAGGWGIFHTKELYDFCCSPDTRWVVK
jgi:hypothetical protein